jgi:uncharacterized repeat protein (TIGR01451 family)
MRASLTKCAAVISIATTNVNAGSFWFCNSTFNNDATGACSVTISEGDSVTWTNTSGLLHTATQCGASFENIDCPLPGGFDTGLINGSATSAPTVFNTPGEYIYRCEIHPNPPFAMRGRIKVVPVTPPVIEATKSQADLNADLLAPNDVIEYSVTLSNSGGAQSDNAGNEYEDNIPANTSFVVASASASSGTVAFESTPTARIVWNGSIPGGGNVTIGFRVQVSGAAASGALISNQGVANYDSDGNLTNDAQEPTDNPTTTAVNDPTVMTVNAPVNDADGDGYTTAEEEYTGTSPSDRCGNPAWPSDLFSTGASANKLTLQDVTSYVAPPPSKFNTTQGLDPGYVRRWDLFGQNSMINLQDITALVTGSRGTPPMFGGAKAFNGPACSDS